MSSYLLSTVASPIDCRLTSNGSAEEAGDAFRHRDEADGVGEAVDAEVVDEKDGRQRHDRS